MVHLALIGSGNWGKQYIRSIASRDDCQLRYIASPHITSDHGIPNKYTNVVDYRKILSNKEIDGVIIASSLDTHFTIASDFLKNGHNVLVEKPMTTKYKDAIKLKKLVIEKKNTLMVGHLYHYNPGFQTLLKHREKIGSYRFIQTAAGKADCFSAHPSALWEWGPHDVAMCLEVVGEMPVAVSAHAGYIKEKIDFQVFVTMYFQNNIKAFLHLGWCFPRKKRVFTLTGSKGQLVFDDVEKKVAWDNGKGKILITTHTDPQPLQEELSEFIRAIKQKNEPETGVEEGIRVVKILQQAEASISHNGKVYKINP